MKHFFIGIFSFTLLFLNTCFWGGLIILLTPFKLLFLHSTFLSKINWSIVTCGEWWTRLNNLFFSALHATRWEISNIENLDTQSSYLVVANHQSWVDILSLQKAFAQKIPLLRFFLKRELMTLPILGQAWWALDFPAVHRHSKSFLLKNPERREDDTRLIRKKCEKFKNHPVSILNFLEGTRWTKEKHESQESKFKFLLRPKAGGMELVLNAMGEQFKALLDVTLVYPGFEPTFWRFLSGQIPKIIVHVQALPVPVGLGRPALEKWLDDLWQEKDLFLENARALT